MLELYNLNYSEDIAIFSNLTYNLTATFRKKALYYKATRILRTIYKIGMSRKASGAYIIKDASVDIYSLIDKLIIDGLIE